jgi:hypothetical protein
MNRAVIACVLAACSGPSAPDASFDAARDAPSGIDAAPDARDGAPDANEVCVPLGGGACDGTAASCEGPIPALVPGVASYGNFAREALSVADRGCPEGGISHFLRLRVPELSHVYVAVEIDGAELPRREGVSACAIGCEPEPGEPLPPGCCETSFYRVLLETECGADDTQLLAGTSGALGCFASGPAGVFDEGYNGVIDLVGLYIPAGDYIVEIHAEGTGDHDRPFRVQAELEPALAPLCDASPLAPGVEVTGSTDGADTFRTDCSGAGDPSLSSERIHPFALASRSRVRLESFAGDPVRTRIFDRCAIDAAELGCARTACGGGDALEVVLDAGEYYASIEGAAAREIAPARYYEAGPTLYRMVLSIEAVELACEGALTLGAGAVSHTTAGEPDRIRIPRRAPTDCAFAGRGDAPDRAYGFSLAAESTVRFALTDAFAGASLALYRGCGESRIAGGAGVIEIEERLEPGDYSLFVGGGSPGEEGNYDLEVSGL